MPFRADGPGHAERHGGRSLQLRPIRKVIALAFLSRTRARRDDLLKRWQKTLWYQLTNPLMWLNGKRYRFSLAPKEGLRVHLGCGREHYLPGWLNVDSNCVTARVDLWINLLHRFPFRNASVEALYTWHVLEHLPYDGILPVLKEMYRCLQEGGVARIGVPHVGSAARAYVAGNADWFVDYPMQHSSLGGKFANFTLCAGEHLQMFDFDFLAELLHDAGFERIEQHRPGDSERFDATVLTRESVHPKAECRDLPYTLVVEAIKGSAASSRGDEFASRVAAA